MIARNCLHHQTISCGKIVELARISNRANAIFLSSLVSVVLLRLHVLETVVIELRGPRNPHTGKHPESTWVPHVRKLMSCPRINHAKWHKPLDLPRYWVMVREPGRGVDLVDSKLGWLIPDLALDVLHKQYPCDPDPLTTALYSYGIGCSIEDVPPVWNRGD